MASATCQRWSPERIRHVSDRAGGGVGRARRGCERCPCGGGRRGRVRGGRWGRGRRRRWRRGGGERVQWFHDEHVDGRGRPERVRRGGPGGRRSRRHRGHGGGRQRQPAQRLGHPAGDREAEPLDGRARPARGAAARSDAASTVVTTIHASSTTAIALITPKAATTGSTVAAQPRSGRRGRAGRGEAPTGPPQHAAEDGEGQESEPCGGGDAHRRSSGSRVSTRPSARVTVRPGQSGVGPGRAPSATPPSTVPTGRAVVGPPVRPDVDDEQRPGRRSEHGGRGRSVAVPRTDQGEVARSPDRVAPALDVDHRGVVAGRDRWGDVGRRGARGRERGDAGGGGGPLRCDERGWRRGPRVVPAGPGREPEEGGQADGAHRRGAGRRRERLRRVAAPGTGRRSARPARSSSAVGSAAGPARSVLQVSPPPGGARGGRRRWRIRGRCARTVGRRGQAGVRHHAGGGRRGSRRAMVVRSVRRPWRGSHRTCSSRRRPRPRRRAHGRPASGPAVEEVPQQVAQSGDVLRGAALAEGPGLGEAAQHRAPPGVEQHVAGLDPAVHHAEAVQGLDDRRDGEHRRHGAVERPRSSAVVEGATPHPPGDAAPGPSTSPGSRRGRRRPGGGAGPGPLPPGAAGPHRRRAGRS